MTSIAAVEHLWTWLTPWTIILFLGACAGHAALQIFGLNNFLGWPWPRTTASVVRKISMAAIFVVPVFVWFIFVLGLENLSTSIAGFVLLLFLWICWVVGFLILPVLHAWYLWSKAAATTVENKSEIVDVAAQLGYTPFGRGKYIRLARFPANQIFQVEFAERHLHLQGLPEAWAGLTILHLSDLHFCGIPDKAFYQEVMDRCNHWEPELIAITGDIVDSHKHHRWVTPVLERLRWQTGAFAILGNHDKWYDPGTVRRRLRKLHLDVLGNAWRQIEVRGEPLSVIGHEGPWFTPPPDLGDCPAGFRLCLSHTPDNIAWARANHIDLMLAGHNHGGQIRFPFIGSVYVPSRYGRRFDCGVFRRPPTLLHVSRGLAGQHPIRYGCRPEATLLILQPTN